jgi:hypothetical protein
MKYFCTLICSLALPVLGFCQDMQKKDAQEIKMEQAPIQSVPPKPVTAYSVGLKIEPLSQEQIQAGVTNELLQSLILKKLEEVGIALDVSIQQPMLVLRVRSIQTGLDIATFFQLSLQEDSMLVRNRSLFQAVTWSQASLLACRPEDLKKEVIETIDMMVQAFAKDYAKALQQ